MARNVEKRVHGLLKNGENFLEAGRSVYEV